MKISLPSVLSFTLLLFVVLLTLGPVVASAWVPGQPVVPCGGDIACKACHIFPLANNIIGLVVFALAMPFAVIMILWGGVLMVTGAGNPGQLEKGKEYLLWAVIGLVVAFAGWIIVDTMIKGLTVRDGAFLLGRPWNEFPPCGQ